jgi:hypothetical protein
MPACVQQWRAAEREEEQDALGAEEGVHGVAVQPAVDLSRAARDWRDGTLRR